MKPKPLRFSLRAFLFCVSLISIFVGMRLNERRNLAAAARQVRLAGCTVYFTWQAPRLVKEERERHETGMEGGGSTYRYTVTRVDTISDAKPRPYFDGFISGRHNAVKIEAVVVPIHSVDDELISVLKRVKGLELIKMDTRLPEATSPLTGDAYDRWLTAMASDRNDKQALLLQNFPGIVVAQ